jgi:chromosome segregation ATPase
MSRPTSEPAELGMLREVIQQFRRVLTEWDRFLDWVEAERRELRDLRVQVSELAREHARLHETWERLCEENQHERGEHAQLRSAHDALREDYERTQEEMRTLRLTHESVLRERRDTYDVLEAALRRLRP